MTTTQQLGLGVVLALVAFTSAFLGVRVAGGGALLGGSGAYEALQTWYGNGIFAGLTKQLTIDSDGDILSSATVSVGSTGTALTRLNGGYCDLNFGTTTSAIAASSTVAVDCQGTNMLASASATQSALPGITSMDRVRVQLASTTPSTYLGVWLSGCSASSTPGYITCRLTNGTGASITPATTTTRFAQYWGDK